MLGVDRRMSLRGLSFLWGRATRDREWKEACAETHGVVDKYIERALAEKADSEAKSSPSKDTSETVDSDGSIPGDQKRPISFLHELVKETSDRQFIRDQIISLFFPARDASAIAISDLFFQLARNPGVWTKLRSEVLNHEEPLTFESLKTMKYLQAVLNESKPSTYSYHSNTPCILPFLQTMSKKKASCLSLPPSHAHRSPPPRSRLRLPPHMHPHHHPPPRRRTQRLLPHPRPPRHPHRLPLRHHATRHQHLGTRRRSLSSRALDRGNFTTGVDLCAVFGRGKDLSCTADGFVSDGVFAGKVCGEV